MNQKTPVSEQINDYIRKKEKIPISQESLDYEAQSTNYRNIIKWAINGVSSGLLYQGLLSIGFVSILIFLGTQEGFTYFWSFVFLALSLAISNILTLISGLFIGTLSDIFGKRKQLVLILTSISTLLFALIASWLNFYFTIVLFIIGNTIFQISRIIFDSQILFIAETESRGTVNGISGIFHFAGSGIVILVTLILLFTCGEFTSLNDIQNGLVSAEQIQFAGIRWIFPICAIIMLISLLPYFFMTEKSQKTDKIKDENGRFKKKMIIKKTFSEIKDGFQKFVNNKNSLLFLFGWFFVSCGITIIIVFFYELIQRLIQKDNWIILLIIGVLALAAMLSSYITGSFIDEIGPKIYFIFNITNAFIGLILTAITGYSQVVSEEIGPPLVVVVFQINWWVIFIGAIFLGFALGGFWVIGKQFLMELAPPKKIGQAFGYMNAVTQLGAVFGTFVFYGIISFINNYIKEGNSYRISLFIILGLFLVSVLFFIFITNTHPRYVVGERAPYKPSEIRLKRKSKKINVFVRILYRLQYIYSKFQALIAIVQATSYFILLFSVVLDLVFPWYFYLIIAGTGIPFLISFVYFLERIGGAWHAEKRTEFKMLKSQLFLLKSKYIMIKNVMSVRMNSKEKEKRIEQTHPSLELDAKLFEYEILKEIKKMREKKEDHKNNK